MIAQSPPASAWTRSKPPLLRFLDTCLNEFSAETSGTVADYIPELGKADPDRFGISLATLDGHVYEVGDTRIPFTVQSMSNAGAIASSGLIHEAKGDGAYEYIRDALSRFAGRELGIDEAVLASESA